MRGRLITTGLVVVLLVGSFVIRANTHTGNCKQTSDGLVCEILWGAK